ncbi:phosphate ABC transporter substrate-binding protein PstS [Longimicrobium sp.]|uniref:phosphate ABC transporter substrate-binding protein PstS n=1 Tax=Longimicrobium sp. TaxID=2029185 RepID=UPI002B54F26C|nr:phosphate ABC transporter substrate-binding protein PstS [Longimicrobium sp.]HSU13249.1 phosphate ABC transporter substrate-binding protein PstS [Longimicrobium sp.]
MKRILTAAALAATLLPAAARAQTLTAAGATFPAPLYTRWFAEYRAAHGVAVNYQAIGSGGGIKNLQEMTVDFGATDGPMSDAEMAAARGGQVLHIPTTLGAVAVTYNVPGVAGGLKLTPEVIASIFNGTLRGWDDARIRALNPGVALPHRPVLVAHRSDGSGTTYIFTDFLSSASAMWRRTIGTGKSVSWPVGLGGRGNEGVAGIVKQTPGSIGYVELAYANQNRLPVAAIRNRAGQFVMPTTESTTAAAAGVAVPANSDLRISIVNGPGANAYPISSFTWIITYADVRDNAKARQIRDFLTWAVHEGQRFGPALDYAPLPAAIVAADEAKIRLIH